MSDQAKAVMNAKTLVDQIFQLKIHQMDIQRELEIKKCELVDAVIDAGLIDCITVNIDRVRRHTKNFN